MDSIWETNFGNLKNGYYKSGKNCDGKEILNYEVCRYVYKITCIENNKAYIGRSQCPVTRIREHYIALRNGKHKQKGFQEDFDRYGENAFTFEILGEDNFGLNVEKRMQKIFKTYLPEYGYNTKDQNWYRNKKPSDVPVEYLLNNSNLNENTNQI